MAEMPEITVVVESVMFNAIKDVLQAIHDQHGIIVEGVRVSWVDIAVIGSPLRSVIVEVEIDSRKAFLVERKEEA